MRGTNTSSGTIAQSETGCRRARVAVKGSLRWEQTNDIGDAKWDSCGIPDVIVVLRSRAPQSSSCSVIALAAGGFAHPLVAFMVGLHQSESITRFQYFARGFSYFWVVLLALLLAGIDMPVVGAASDEVSSEVIEIELEFNDETTLGTFITFVSDELEINVIYRREEAKLPVTLLSPTSVRRQDLMALLQRIVQVHNLVLTPTEVANIWRLVPVDQAAAGDAGGQGSPIETRLIPVRHAGLDAAQEAAMQLVSKPGGKVVKLAQTQMLMVSDYASNVERVVAMLKAADILPVQPQRIYRLEHAWPETVHNLIEDSLPEGVLGQILQIASDPRMRLLVVNGPEHLLTRIDELVAAVDVDSPEVERPVRFYKLRNVIASDVLATLRALEGQSNSVESGFALGLPGLPGVPGVPGLPGAGLVPEVEPRGPLFGPRSEVTEDGEASERDQGILGRREAAGSGAGGVSPDSSGFSTKTQARIAADVQTNSIIIIAPPEEQEMYAEIIEKLDQRRPQVLIETTIVSLDTSDDFTLGIEIGSSASGSDGRIIAFSAFGLSDITIDPDDFTQLPAAAVGGNFAILAPDIANVIVRALATNTRSKLVSMPRVLVNDNETGVLSSVTEQPFQRTVITDNTTIVGEGNFATAGTEIALTASISEGDYLQLDYAVELSNFLGQPQDNLPPPAQRNQVSSRVTIPDGYTIVVGGLNQSNFSETLRKVPLLGDLPLIKYLFRSTDTNTANTTLFVFIRPTIFRDPAFADLTTQSDLDLDAAGLPTNYPMSDPLILDPTLEWH